jgi:hypothetical protein
MRVVLVPGLHLLRHHRPQELVVRSAQAGPGRCQDRLQHLSEPDKAGVVPAGPAGAGEGCCV